MILLRSWNRTTRGHAFKLFKPPAVREVNSIFSLNGLYQIGIPYRVVLVEACTINKFKALFDDYNKNNNCLYVY